MNNNNLCFLPSPTCTQSEGLPLGLPPWFTGNQHHLPSCKHSQVLKLFLPNIQLRHRLPFWAWARVFAMLFSCLDNASHQGTASDTSDVKFTHVFALTSWTLFLFSNSSRGLACVSARHRVTTYACKIFLSTFGQWFPMPHRQMWWRVAISLAFHSALSSELLLYVTVADRIRWEHFHWRENHGAQIPMLSPTGLVIQFVLTAFYKIRTMKSNSKDCFGNHTR